MLPFVFLLSGHLQMVFAPNKIAPTQSLEISRNKSLSLFLGSMTTLTTLENNWTIEQFIWWYCIVLYRIWSYCIVLFGRIALHHNWHQYGQWDSSINWMTVLLTLSQFEMFVLLSIADIKYRIVPGSSKKSLNLCVWQFSYINCDIASPPWSITVSIIDAIMGNLSRTVASWSINGSFICSNWLHVPIAI